MMPEVIGVLRLVGMNEAIGTPIDADAASLELGTTRASFVDASRAVLAAGLAIDAAEGDPPVLTRAGRQYMTAGGDVDEDVLGFLPHAVDDLAAREALLRAGRVILAEFRRALVAGRGVDHASQIVPPAFARALTECDAVNLFAASVALMARLSAGDPAGCVAEEIVAVVLMDEAERWIEVRQDLGHLDPEGAAAAVDHLRDLFELFGDDDVLDMFDMEEPADAALAGHSFISRQMGVVDQRVEAWFRPFGGTSPTGYLDTSAADR